MLEIKEKTTLTGKSVINGVEVCGYQAQIDSDNPADIAFTDWQIDKGLYKANRAECRADQAAFEDRAFEIQDEMLSDITE